MKLKRDPEPYDPRWRKVFAWKPVPVSRTEYRWLEWVEVRDVDGLYNIMGGGVEYRARED